MQDLLPRGEFVGVFALRCGELGGADFRPAKDITAEAIICDPVELMCIVEDAETTILSAAAAALR